MGDRQVHGGARRLLFVWDRTSAAGLSVCRSNLCKTICETMFCAEAQCNSYAAVLPSHAIPAPPRGRGSSAVRPRCHTCLHACETCMRKLLQVRRLKRNMEPRGNRGGGGGGDGVACLFSVGALEGVCFHMDKVHEAPEVVLEADRQMHGCAVVAELVPDLADHAPRRRAGAVALVDEREAGHAVTAHLAVDRDRLRLHSPCRHTHVAGQA